MRDRKHVLPGVLEGLEPPGSLLQIIQKVLHKQCIEDVAQDHEFVGVNQDSDFSDSSGQFLGLEPVAPHGHSDERHEGAVALGSLGAL